MATVDRKALSAAEISGDAHAHDHGPDDPMLAGARETLSRYIAEKGLKSTRQRDIIADTFLAQSGHLNVEELLAQVRTQDDRISAATVYRTMKLLTECGLAAPRRFDDGQTRYESAVGRHHHDHLICKRCHTIIEFEDDRIEVLQQAVARRHGFLVTHHKLEMYGLCSSCQAAGATAEAEHVAPTPTRRRRDGNAS
jgi:Fur family ferric uptake transcriptional regulator